MPHFGTKSKEKLSTCDPRIQSILREVIKDFDFAVLEGRRSSERQAELYAQGRTAPGPIVTYAKPGQSDHESGDKLSPAVDIAPYPIDFDDRERFCELAARVEQEASLQGVPMRWGGTFVAIEDLPHFVIVED
jgi:peptidoglycan L-alanyl-D-glutamate endopeptidase CwlK